MRERTAGRRASVGEVEELLRPSAVKRLVEQEPLEIMTDGIFLGHRDPAIELQAQFPDDLRRLEHAKPRGDISAISANGVIAGG